MEAKADARIRDANERADAAIRSRSDDAREQKGVVASLEARLADSG